MIVHIRVDRNDRVQISFNGGTFWYQESTSAWQLCRYFERILTEGQRTEARKKPIAFKLLVERSSQHD